VQSYDAKCYENIAIINKFHPNSCVLIKGMQMIILLPLYCK